MFSHVVISTSNLILFKQPPPPRNPTPELFPTPPIPSSELTPGYIRQKTEVRKHLVLIKIGNRGKTIGIQFFLWKKIDFNRFKIESSLFSGITINPLIYKINDYKLGNINIKFPKLIFCNISLSFHL